MKLKKGDIVLIIKGKDRTKKGKILKVFTAESKIIVEGINLRKKHAKARRAGQKGQIIEISAPISAANVKLLCPKCALPARIGFKVAVNDEGRKVGKFRICKKCKAEIS
ncbi:50S ribosomal protein L24 [Candidatus Azambacteria bacterium RIFCSPLOWO2_01_FULL_46_26]|uniref:Large ribosomal subunit protein uL24 n=1 Tax=Candidatus Azambacteria bacterium RIFCSPLOWO2_01_FULL_46_26 TaxID=1797299 RepID=A0A1F5C6L4_9BACT|nr:MAG: 50S ribosomal protein L24 [Candidatus Azambacteria bacterium RIFCSPLOWO2_01_FULL_46_26]